ncbi:MAG: hypothetical protein CL878_01935 [Dehalococcoidia bacterium]|nr:hypothetical protein [Dehalococcoidia bacterium]
MAQDAEATTTEEQSDADVPRRPRNWTWLPGAGLVVGGGLGAALAPMIGPTAKESLSWLAVAPGLGAAIGLFAGAGVLALLLDRANQRAIERSQRWPEL